MNILLLKRYLVFIIGVLINSFGISFITKASLGTSPISSVPYVFSLRFAPTLGEFSFVLNSAFILLQLLLLRRDFQTAGHLLRNGVKVCIGAAKLYRIFVKL